MTIVTMRAVTITPSMASRMLMMNIKNRPLNEQRCFRLSEAIKRGEWQMNGDTIRISESGVVLDGQHRLKAIELSGISVETILVEGLPNDVFHTIDVNAKSRTTSDVLAIQGEKNYNALAAAASILYRYMTTGNPYDTNRKEQPTTQQLELILKQNTGIKECISFCIGKKWVRKYITASAGGFSLYVFKKVNEQKAYEFFEKLESGAELEQTSPILLLRDRLVLEANDTKTSLSKKYKMLLIFKAFKLFLKGASVKVLKVAEISNNAEKDIFKI